MQKYIVVLFIIIFTVISSPGRAASYNVEAKAEYETWRSTGLAGEASAVLSGLSFGYYENSYFGGIGFVTGDYDVDESRNKLERLDVDAVLGYRMDKQYSIIAGYRLNNITYDTSTTKSEEVVHGLGVGLVYQQHLFKDTTGFGLITGGVLYSQLEYDDIDGSHSEDGQGFSIGTEAGVLYRITQHIDSAIRIKYQTNRLSYSDSNWSHSYFRLGFNVSYVF